MTFIGAQDIKRVALIGGGVIGGGWAARLLARGYDVVAYDPGKDAEKTLRHKVAKAWPALTRIGLAAGADQSRLTFVDSVAEALVDADFVQESAPENEDLKRRLLAEIDKAARPEVIIASSSSGLLPTRIQAECRHPERVVIGHPFNPVYLLPLVEVLGGEKTAAPAVDAAMEFYRHIGMHALKVRKEIEGYISDRLQEALWREILHMVNEGVASTGEIDEAICYGPGLRWSFMGTCMIFHLAGGDEGMRHMLRQFGPALKLPWTKLIAPELTEELIDRMVEGTQAQAAGRSIDELEALRDNCLIAVMQALRQYDTGAGRVLAEDEARRYGAQATARWQEGAPVQSPLEILQRKVDMGWIDYNGHMSEACYLTAFGDASDALFRYIGIDEAYRAAGGSFYTVESHINYHREVAGGEALKFTTQILDLDEKRLHLFHAMYHGTSGELLATTEQMLLHVDTKAGKATPIAPKVFKALQAVHEAHRSLPPPENAGRRIAVRRGALA